MYFFISFDVGILVNRSLQLIKSPLIKHGLLIKYGVDYYFQHSLCVNERGAVR